MNCNIYFFIGTQKGYSQYPDNYTKDIIANILAKTDRKINNSQFAISMNGKLAYLTYQYRYSDSKYFGVCCEYNGVVPSNFEYLFEFYDNLMQDILKRGEIIHYDSSGTMCPSIDYISDKVELINYYCNFISHNFDDELAKYIALPSQIYTSEKKKVATIAYGDAQEQLLDVLNTYDNVIVSRENPYALGYANTLKKSSERISQLEKEVARINRQKKQYRMVVFLLIAVAGCLVSLYSFNSNIQSLNSDLSQRKEEIKTLNGDLTATKAKIDTMSLELSDKNQRIGVLQKESIKNRNSIDSLKSLTHNQETIIGYMSTSLCSAQENLNEIRFKGWTEKEWLDNDYIRELRKYINACSEGEIKDQTLLAHKEVLKSKFIMGHIEPATYGGVFIYFTFLDAPRKVFYTQVYSYVNPDTKKINGYEVRGVFLNEEEIDYTRETLLYIVENYPEHKLW